MNENKQTGRHPATPFGRRGFLQALGALTGTALMARPASAAFPAQQDPARLADIISLQDAEAAARARLPGALFAYLAGGAGDEITLRANEEAYRKILLRPNVLQDVEKLDTSIELLGRKESCPVLFAPTAFNGLMHPDGERAVARAAATTGATYVLSSGSNTAIEDVMAVSTQPVWFQLYIQADPSFTRDLVQRVEAAGAEALCVTVDSVVSGARNTEQRAGFTLPPGTKMPMLEGIKIPRYQVSLENVRPARLVWKDIERLRSSTRLPIFLKGILNPDDAEMAVRVGANGIIVSNHGGRVLDTLPATVDALPAITRRVAGRVPVLVDGGVRRGTDVIKALAFGATAVLIGRPYVYGLAAAGEAGVVHVQKVLRQELLMAMALLGRPSIASIDRSVIWSDT